MISRIMVAESAAWARERLSPFGKRLVADFVLTETLTLAQRSTKPARSILMTLTLAFRYGRPTAVVTLRALLIWGRSLFRPTRRK